MKFTAETRPRSASGVPSWMMIWRATMLTSSAMPATTSEANESQKSREKPKAMVASPNTATATNSARPGRASPGRSVSTPDMAKVPIASAEESRP